MAVGQLQIGDHRLAQSLHLNRLLISAYNRVGAAGEQSLHGFARTGNLLQIHPQAFLLEVAQLLRQKRRLGPLKSHQANTPRVGIPTTSQQDQSKDK